jgi:hypothetical protein
MRNGVCVTPDTTLFATPSDAPDGMTIESAEVMLGLEGVPVADVVDLNVGVTGFPLAGADPFAPTTLIVSAFPDALAVIPRLIGAFIP